MNMNTISVSEVCRCKECNSCARLQNMSVVDNKVIYGIYKCECGNEIKMIVGWIDVVTKEELKRKSIGQILDLLDDMDGQKLIKTNIPGSEYIETDYGSDRGDYSNLYISVCSEDKSNVTVANLINLLENALEDQVMCGYKGGEYDITEETLVTLGSYGYSGKYIVDVVENDKCVMLLAKIN